MVIQTNLNTLKNRNNSYQSVALQLNGTGIFNDLQEGEMKIYETIQVLKHIALSQITYPLRAGRQCKTRCQ